ncbi:MAG: hypothetical protein LBR11_05955 [Deltaproteobacteria bacterium]|jgi:hypothetical protein|nr:hypothetical protein [Deltaproteobacteria bacterium]
MGEITKIPLYDDEPEPVNFLDFYSLKFPNWEVEKSYYLDFFRSIIDPDLAKKLTRWPKKLTKVFLSHDAKKVSSIFSEFFAALPIQLKSEGEKSFRALIKLFFSAQGLRVKSEPLTALGIFTLLVELTDQIVSLATITRQPNIHPARTEEQERILSYLAAEPLPIAEAIEGLDLYACWKRVW